MSEVRYFGVKNLDKHQHYKDRRPPWVKLHRTVFNDYAFSRLQGASKAHLMLLWLLASEYDNRMPYDPEWVGRKIDAQEPVDLDALVSAGFLTLYHDASSTLAECTKTVSPEDREQRTEKEPSSSPRAAIVRGKATVSPFWGKVANALRSSLDAECLETLCAAVPNVDPWLAEMASALDGMHGAVLAPAQLAQAVRDYVGNGEHRRANLRHFRGYLRNASAGERAPPARGRLPSPPTNGITNRVFSTVLDAIPDPDVA